ncbi:endonuclease III domain-containing protein [Planctomyces sp. SH-PL62]|uniref:endonuclease III domain-containing protein n=1 Tax=Planctomyces sp. SH-PL62 TaxID=1636152 RepID=UPI00078BED78|nr:endonuclease III [Planctomyces sp. SH-PL62]AMV37801.1 Endonuclease III [Planctomyces sp. SH-PL62]
MGEGTEGRGGTEPWDADEAFRRLREAVRGLPKAAVFDLRDRGFGSPFEVLVASLISARTRDETTLAVGLRLFPIAASPQAMIDLGEARLVELIRPATFPEPKARDILELSRRILAEHGGEVPETVEELTAFRGVGPKIAALTRAVAFGAATIPVDVHVHRVANRWGLVATRTPEATMKALEAVLPRRYWIETNERLVPFGKFICTGVAPFCSTCLLLSMCRRVGVTRSR